MKKAEHNHVNQGGKGANSTCPACNPPMTQKDRVREIKKTRDALRELEAQMEERLKSLKVQRRALQVHLSHTKVGCEHKHEDGSSARWSNYSGKGCGICDHRSGE